MISLLTAFLAACTSTEPDTQSDNDTGPAVSPETYTDTDQDGYYSCGTPDEELQSFCNNLPTDCNDNNPNIHPDADETACDGIDQDCDGTDLTDGDGDGYDDLQAGGTDCDDKNALINPDAEEVWYDGVDQNCDGLDDYDKDADGFVKDAGQAGRLTSDVIDCDDNDGTVNPDAIEVCDGLDNDCNGTTDGADAADAINWYSDNDRDGYGDSSASFTTACEAPESLAAYVSIAGDCDDSAATVNPLAPETCNGIDDDCDTSIDEDLATTILFADGDGDGFGDPLYPLETCESSVIGYSANDLDCDDGSETVSPDGYDVCDDGTDQDCSGDDEVCVSTPTDLDGDGDGHDDVAFGGTDCDDTSAAVNPDALEICDGADNNCDTLIDDEDPAVTGTSTWYADGDGDGVYSATDTLAACESTGAYTSTTAPTAGAEDCNDADDSVAADQTYYTDSDADGFGTSTTAEFCSSTAPAGFTTDASASDCNDGVASIYPGAPETCDGVDEDCDSSIDNGLATSTFYNDDDGDGYGDPAAATTTCAASVSGTVVNALDCDDTDTFTNPDGTEVCGDGIDQNCDSVDLTCSVSDADGDGVTTEDGDCDDTSALVSPLLAETEYDGIDNDCDTTTPDDDIDGDGYTFLGDADCNDDDGTVFQNATIYADDDSDGYTYSSTAECIGTTAPAGYSLTASATTDCNDSNDDINPGAVEVCDAANTDENCDGSADDASATGQVTRYLDFDLDGYGSTTGQTACDPTYTATTATDCNDGSSSIFPGATEVCDGIDQDCDTTADDGLATSTFYNDGDSDGYGDPLVSTTTCETAVTGYVANALDCDDVVGTINPDATEVCDGEDNDCNTLIDDADTGLDTSTAVAWYRDADADAYGTSTSSVLACEEPAGYVADATDCSDAIASIHPGAAETCNSVDDNCDSLIDDEDPAVTGTSTWYGDSDLDGFYDVSNTNTACASTGIYTSDVRPATGDDDCADDDNTTYPGATEVCEDGTINDCDDDGTAAAAACELSGTVSLATDYDERSRGGSTNLNFGWSVGSADVNGDGYDDWLRGAPDLSSSTGGYVSLRMGSPTGLGSASTYLYGTTAGDQAGYAVAGVGDVDGDGYEDVVVGAIGEDTNGSQAGAAYLVGGADVATDYLDSLATSVMYGDGENNEAGVQVAAAGDVNGDGFADFLVGATGYGNSSGSYGYGRAYLNYGPVSGDFDLGDSATVITGSSFYNQTGTALSGGDVDGDGIDDFMVGSSNNRDNGVSDLFGAGRADIFLGGTTELSSTTNDASDIQLLGEAGGDLFGYSGTIASDLDNDGYNDGVLCGVGESSSGSGSGACYLFLSGGTSMASTYTAGTNSNTKWMGPEEGTYVGNSVTTGDLNGDGIPDLVIGANGAEVLSTSSYIGGAFVFHGPLSAGGSVLITTADAKLEAEDQDDLAGASLGTGDFDADDFDDLTVGAPYYDYTTSITNSGASYVVYGTGF